MNLMGRDTKRQTAKLPFRGKPIEFYRPTEGQATGVVLAGRLKGTDSLLRFFRVLELLTVRPKDWEWMEEQLIEGKADVSDYSDLMTTLFNYEWPEETPES